jgi:hypothetical protein
MIAKSENSTTRDSYQSCGQQEPDVGRTQSSVSRTQFNKWLNEFMNEYKFKVTYTM